MKKIITFILLFMLMFTINGIAQGPGDTHAQSDNKTWKGRRELKKEKKRHRASMALVNENEKKSRWAKNHRDNSKYKVGPSRRQRNQRNQRSRKDVEKDKQVKATEQKSKDVQNDTKIKG